MWNQLITNGYPTSLNLWQNRFSTTYRYNDNQIIAEIPAGDEAAGMQEQESINSIIDHIYYCSILGKSDTSSIAVYSPYIYFSHTIIYGKDTDNISTSWKRMDCICKAAKSDKVGIGLRSSVDYHDVTTLYMKNAMCIDLTQMFGSGNEPSTVEEFKQLFPQNR